jgi:ATP-dependent Zn protease
VREELLHNVLEPIAHPERFRALGLEVPAGVLFFGPPGSVTLPSDITRIDIEDGNMFVLPSI